MPVIFIEGLPGSGKTTFAKKISNYYSEQGKEVIMFQEGDLHPIDLAWCSYMDKEVFNDYRKKYPQLDEQIMNHTKELGDKIVTAYTKVHVDQEDVSFYRDFEKYEIYQLDDINEFLSIHEKLYKQFAKDYNPETYYIFECILLQNHVNEMILKYNLSIEEMKAYYSKLTKDITQIEAEVIYIKQEDVDVILSRIIEERRSPNKEIYKDWIDLVVDYWGSQPYAKELGYQGIEGAYKYFKDRQVIELKLLSDFPLESVVVKLKENYEDTFNQIINTISKKR